MTTANLQASAANQMRGEREAPGPRQVHSDGLALFPSSSLLLLLRGPEAPPATSVPFCGQIRPHDRIRADPTSDGYRLHKAGVRPIHAPFPAQAER